MIHLDQYICRAIPVLLIHENKKTAESWQEAVIPHLSWSATIMAAGVATQAAVSVMA
jgi:hypothetical protein